MKRNGFTLIELLIVIAIILILIAIALPNFLEAQIRAKTTKSDAEMRGLSQALEAYRNDFPRYPPQAAYEKTQFNPILPGLSNNCWSLMQLTTPIAYIKKLPLDLFAPQNGEMIRNGSTGEMMKPHPADIAHGFTYLYWSQDSLRFVRNISTADAMKANGINYVILGLAPNRELDTINLNARDMAHMRINAVNWIYSPTNGTTSKGDLLRTRP
jgi:prepilin-type N-terminal cleavage/methylation domain-containing protein